MLDALLLSHAILAAAAAVVATPIAIAAYRHPERRAAHTSAALD